MTEINTSTEQLGKTPEFTPTRELPSPPDLGAKEGKPANVVIPAPEVHEQPSDKVVTPPPASRKISRGFIIPPDAEEGSLPTTIEAVSNKIDGKSPAY